MRFCNKLFIKVPLHPFHVNLPAFAERHALLFQHFHLAFFAAEREIGGKGAV